MHCISIRALSCAILFGSLLPMSASAAIYTPGDTITGVNGEVFGWSRGDTNSTYSGWDFFEDVATGGGAPFADSTPDLGLFGTASTLSTSGGYIPVGSGNIYSPGAALDFSSIVRSGTPGSNTRIVAQFQTGGNELDYSSILLSTSSAAEGTIAPSMVKEISRTALGGFGGTGIEYLALWDISGTQAEYRLDFNAAGSSLSLQQFHVDSLTQTASFVTPTAVPEPGSFALLCVAGLSSWATRRVRRPRPIKS